MPVYQTKSPEELRFEDYAVWIFPADAEDCEKSLVWRQQDGTICRSKRIA